MDRHTLHRLRNLLHSAVLVLGMALIVAACAWTLWGWQGVLWAIIMLAVSLVLSPTIPPAAVLSMYGAQPLGPTVFPDGYAILEDLSRCAGLPATPRLYYVPSAVMNAFAVGSRRASAIALTDGMLRRLSLRELGGVLAHEVSHIASNDLWIMNLADIMSRAATILSYFGMFLLLLNLPMAVAGAVAVPWLLVLLLVFAPTIMSLLQLALSRAREYDADLEAARLSGDPKALAAALVKMERYQGRIWESLLFPGTRVPDPSLLRSHPPTEARVRRLLELQGVPPAPFSYPPDELPALPAGYRVVRGPPRRRWTGLWY
jgi:heat shock protein HtpX